MQWQRVAPGDAADRARRGGQLRLGLCLRGGLSVPQGRTAAALLRRQRRPPHRLARRLSWAGDAAAGWVCRVDAGQQDTDRYARNAACTVQRAPAPRQRRRRRRHDQSGGRGRSTAGASPIQFLSRPMSPINRCNGATGATCRRWRAAKSGSSLSCATQRSTPSHSVIDPMYAISQQARRAQRPALVLPQPNTRRK